MPNGFQTDDEGYFIFKDPNAAKNYEVDWTKFLNGEDTLSDVDWTVPAGITKVSEFYDTVSATIILSGGTVGENYSITCNIQTANGVEDDLTFRVIVGEK